MILIEDIDPSILEGKEWKRGDLHRIYIDIHDLLDMQVDFYRTGNVSNVLLSDGTQKSNSWYNKNFSGGKLYVDVNAKNLIAEGLGKEARELVVEAVEELENPPIEELNKTEKMIVEQLPLRFEAMAQPESKPQAPLTLIERVRNFRNVIIQAFEPVIQMLMKADREYIIGLVKKVAEDKDIFGREQLLVSKWNERDSDGREKLLRKRANKEIFDDVVKTTAKLLLLDDVKLGRYDTQNRNMSLSGTIFGSEITYKQQIVHKMNDRGTYFYQFPARIYIDGEFTPEVVYHRWFKQKSEGTFKGVTDILEQLANENAYPVGTKFYKDTKYKVTQAKKGIWPITGYMVVGAKDDALLVRQVKVIPHIYAGNYTEIPRGKQTDIYFELTNEPIGPVEEWATKTTPTKSSLIKRRGIFKAERNFVSREGRKAYKGMQQTIPYPTYTVNKLSPTKYELVFHDPVYGDSKYSFSEVPYESEWEPERKTIFTLDEPIKGAGPYSRSTTLGFSPDESIETLFERLVDRYRNQFSYPDTQDKFFKDLAQVPEPIPTFKEFSAKHKDIKAHKVSTLTIKEYGEEKDVTLKGVMIDGELYTFYRDGEGYTPSLSLKRKLGWTESDNLAFYLHGFNIKEVIGNLLAGVYLVKHHKQNWQKWFTSRGLRLSSSVLHLLYPEKA